MNESIKFLAKKQRSDWKSWRSGWLDGRYFDLSRFAKNGTFLVCLATAGPFSAYLHRLAARRSIINELSKYVDIQSPIQASKIYTRISYMSDGYEKYLPAVLSRLLKDETMFHSWMKVSFTFIQG
jgi:hypothetical protein